ILVVTNVLSYAYFNPTYDWTAANIYSLSSQSEKRLEGLTKPTRIYVIWPKQDQDTLRRMQGLLDNCRALNERVQVEYLSPDVDREKVSQLQDKYKFADRAGILVAYGTDPSVESQFIKASALSTGSEPFGNQRRDTRYFKGESELMNALSFVSGGKTKPIIYFTQGNGELDINDSTSRDLDHGAGQLKQRLAEDNITVKGLQFSSVEGLKSK